MPHPTVIPFTKLQYSILFCGSVIALYRFSPSATPTFSQSQRIRLNQEILIFIQVIAFTDGRYLIRHAILIISAYITLYLSRLVLGVTSNRQVNKSIILWYEK